MKSKHIHLPIAAVLFIILRILLGGHEDMGLTAAGASALSLFIAMVYLWVTYDMGWTSLLAIALLPFTGICSASAALTGSFGNATTILVLATCVMSAALSKNGVAKLISTWFITRKIVNNRPYVFLIMFFAATMLISYFIAAAPAIIIAVALSKGIAESLGCSKDDKFAKSLYMGSLWVCCAGLGATPIGHVIVIPVLNALNSILGYEISWLDYMMVGIPYSILAFIVAMLVIRFIIKPDFEKFSSYDAIERRKELQPLTPQGKITAIAYVLLIICWLFPDVFGGIFPAAAAFVKGYGLAIPSLLAVVAVCAIKVKGEPAIEYREVFKTLPWPTIFFVATIFLYSSVFSMESGGINVFLKNAVTPIAEILPPLAVVALFLFLITFITNFASDTVTGVLGVNVCCPILLSISSAAVSVPGFGVLAAMLCNLGPASPAGSGNIALVMQDGYVNSKELMKYGMLYCMVTYVVTMAVIWPLASLIF